MFEETDPLIPQKLYDNIWIRCEPQIFLEDNNITDPDFLNFDKCTVCSAKKWDNLLVETDFFAILGVSFCVMQNVFNFIKNTRT